MTTLAQNIITHRSVALHELWLEAPGWTNPRTFTGLDAKEIEELGVDIKAKGMQDAPKVQKILINGTIRNLVIDGQRRVLGARDALPKNALIPVVDVSEDAVELTPEIADKLLEIALTSLRHEGLSSYELSNVADGMAKRDRTLDTIGTAIGKSKTWVSRMLKARATATPKLMLQWRKGEITDEQFKELAEVADPDKQAEQTKAVVEARKSGDKAEARVLSKETKETARAEKAGKPTPVTNGVHKPVVKPVVAGPQVQLFANEAEADKSLKPKPPAPKKPSQLAIDELLSFADRRPPTADYVKGLMDGVRYSQGLIEPDKFGRAWVQYVDRIEGKPRPAKKAKSKKAAKPKAAKTRARTSTGKRKR